MKAVLAPSLVVCTGAPKQLTVILKHSQASKPQSCACSPHVTVLPLVAPVQWLLTWRGRRCGTLDLALGIACKYADLLFATAGLLRVELFVDEIIVKMGWICLDIPSTAAVSCDKKSENQCTNSSQTRTQPLTCCLEE